MPNMPQAIQTITFIVGSIVVIFGAYFATYWLARGSQKVNQGRAIRVLDRFAFAKDKSVVVLSVYDKVYLVAFSAGAITVLDRLDAEDIPLSSLEGPLGPHFGAKTPGTVMRGLLKKLPWTKKTANEASIPFELYLQQEQLARQQEAADSIDDLDAAFNRMKNRRGKEAQYSAFSDTAHHEEDIRK